MNKIMCDCSTFHDIYLAMYDLGHSEAICTLIADLVQNIVHLGGLCGGPWFIC